MSNNVNLDWFVCPVTKEKLVEKNGKLSSSFSDYDNKNGYWNFIPEKLKELDSPLWKIWRQLQENGLSSYKNAPVDNLGVGPRDDFMQFAEFCKISGLVLDVGVGPQRMPTHIEYSNKMEATFVGIDPLAGQQPRDFPFVQGLGEYLPFKDELFEQVLFVTSLDHFIDPVIALQEARRVVKKTGSICVWLGEKDKNAPKLTVSPDWYRALKIPEGAEDPFHYRRLSVDTFKACVSKSGLVIHEEQIQTVDPWRRNCFYRITKR